MNTTPYTTRVVASIVLAAVTVLDAPAADAFNQNILYNFTGKADGGNPVGSAIQDAAGNYYGTTYQGGTYKRPNPPYTNQGCGTVYRLAPDGTFTVLASFNGTNGAHGNSTLVLIGSTLYGTTALGGANNAGTVFSVNTNGTNYTVLHSFTGADGSTPLALAAVPRNTLYGIAEFGGASNYGTLFSVSAKGTFNAIKSFDIATNAYPVSLIAGSSGSVVGSTLYGGQVSTGCVYGCGSIFSYVPATKSFKTLFAFPPSGADGYRPYVGSIGPGPTIYGANAYYIFSLNAATGYIDLLTLDFYGNGTGVNSGPLYASPGILYGTLGSSASLPDGLVYSLSNGTFTDQAYFGGRSGGSPDAQPILNKDGNLVGTAAIGGACSTCGAIYLSTPGPTQ